MMMLQEEPGGTETSLYLMMRCPKVKPKWATVLIISLVWISDLMLLKEFKHPADRSYQFWGESGDVAAIFIYISGLKLWSLTVSILRCHRCDMLKLKTSASSSSFCLRAGTVGLFFIFSCSELTTVPVRGARLTLQPVNSCLFSVLASQEDGRYLQVMFVSLGFIKGLSRWFYIL